MTSKNSKRGRRVIAEAEFREEEDMGTGDLSGAEGNDGGAINGAAVAVVAQGCSGALLFFSEVSLYALIATSPNSQPPNSSHPVTST
jgi:hypothetical protein